jgi:ATP/maltotriose-dependent transcriptional regulator MalT
MAVFEREGDHAGLAKSWRLLAWTHGTALQFGMAAEACARAIEEARRAGDTRQLTLAATEYAAAAVFGSTPVASAIERCELMVEQVSGDRQSEATIMAYLGSLLACQGSFDRARELSSRALSMLEELGLDVTYSHLCLESWRIEMTAGDIPAAERVLRDAYERLERVGERYMLSTVAGLLGRTLYVVGRYDEAESLGNFAKDLASEDDVDTQALWRCVLGKVLARRGSATEGEGLVREAIALLAPTDDLPFQCEALLDLAEVQRLTGSDEITATLEAARRLAEAKGNLVQADAIQGVLETTRDRSIV